MSLFAYAAVMIWIGVLPLLFNSMPKRRALLINFIGGFLFLPELHDVVSSGEALPAFDIRPFFFTKTNAMCYGFVLAVLLYDSKRLLAFRPKWFDVPMMIWCVIPFFSGMANTDDLGPRQDLTGTTLIWAIVAAKQQALAWGVPYLAGRLYFDDWEGLREMTVGLLAGGMIYAVLCGVEHIISPQLHSLVWGFHAHDFSQTLRPGLGGVLRYRPTVFMEHGLMVAMWMVAACLLAVWVWWAKTLDRMPKVGPIPSMPMGAAVVVLLVAAVCMNSAGAFGLGIVGAGVLFAACVMRWPVAFLGLLAIGPLYVGGRVLVSLNEPPTGWLQAQFDENSTRELEARMMSKRLFSWAPITGAQVEEKMTETYGKDRAESMFFRFKQEDKLMEKALLRPWFGWGGQARGHILDPATGKDVSITDGYWILTLGNRGFIGLGSLCLAILLPAVRFAFYHPQRQWTLPAVAPAAAIAVILVLSLIDDLSNAMINPLFILASGALASVTGTPLPGSGRTAVRRPQETAQQIEPAEELPEPAVQRPGVLNRRRPTTRPR
jgi:hypothetical protein